MQRGKFLKWEKWDGGIVGDKYATDSWGDKLDVHWPSKGISERVVDIFCFLFIGFFLNHYQDSDAAHYACIIYLNTTCKNMTSGTGVHIAKKVVKWIRKQIEIES